MGGSLARIRETRNAYCILVGKPKGKRSLGRPRDRSKYNIKMGLGWGLARDRYWKSKLQP
jgi:hypothetical protein